MNKTLLTLTLLLLTAASAYPGDWLTYHNPQVGLSFQYPASMRVVERNPVPFGLPAADTAVVDLLADAAGDRGAVVLRFEVSPGIQTAETAAAKARALQQEHSAETDPRKILTTMQLDGHEALVGGGSDQAGTTYRWGVLILRPRLCKVFPLLGGNLSPEAAPPPHDGMFPMLSILRTVHFDTSAK